MIDAKELRALAGTIPHSEWTANAGHVHIAESEDWPAIDINLRLAVNKECSPKLARYIAAAAPAVTLELLDTVEAQAAEIERLRVDAERYRWLSDNAAYVGVNPHAKTCLWTLRGVYEVPGKDFNAAVDDAAKGRIS